MKLKSTDTYEVHSFWDIPQTIVATIKILLTLNPEKSFIFMIGDPANFEGKIKVEVLEK